MAILAVGNIFKKELYTQRMCFIFLKCAHATEKEYKRPGKRDELKKNRLVFEKDMCSY